MFFDNNNLTVKKLMVLYIFKNIDIPLTKNQIINIILENNLIDYFTLQECITELEASDLIGIIESNQKPSYILTKSGQQTIDVFEERIDTDIKNSIKKFISENKGKIKKETEILSNFYKKSENEYIVNLKVIENQITIIDLTLSVVSAKQAKLISEKWKNMAHKVYGDLISSLIN